MIKLKGKLDILINAAGVVNRKSLKEASLVDWDKSKVDGKNSYDGKCERDVSDDKHEHSISQGL
jgi:hypothetical protein